MDLGLSGGTALVTGGTSGIGLAVVQMLLDEGMSVATCGRSRERIEAARERFGDSAALRCESVDVLDADAVSAFVTDVAAPDGLDLLVCNAGQGRRSMFADTSSDEWREELDLKLFSVLNPLRAAIPALHERSGAVVIVNAVLARQPEPQMVATSAARAMVLNLSRSLANELAPEIRVNSILIGLVESGQWQQRWETTASSVNRDQWLAEIAADRGIALGRLGLPEEAAAAIAFLGSRRASFITGAALEVDGGVARYA